MSTNNSEEVELTSCYLAEMSIHKLISVYDLPYFQILRVPTGWIYSYWNQEYQDYTRSVFVKY